MVRPWPVLFFLISSSDSRASGINVSGSVSPSVASDAIVSCPGMQRDGRSSQAPDTTVTRRKGIRGLSGHPVPPDLGQAGLQSYLPIKAWGRWERPALANSVRIWSNGRGWGWRCGGSPEDGTRLHNPSRPLPTCRKTVRSAWR